MPASVPAILDREPGKKRKAARGPDSEDTDPEVIEPAPKAAEQQAAPEEPKGPEQPGATGPERPVPPPPPPRSAVFNPLQALLHMYFRIHCEA